MSWKRANVLDRMAVLLKGLTNPSGYWLDIGTGDGVFTRLLYRDYTHTQPLQMDKHRFRRHSNLAFLSVLQQLPLRPNSIDGMICAQVLHYIPKSHQFSALDHLSSILSEGGQMIIVAYIRGDQYPWVPHHLTEDDIRRYDHLSDSIHLHTIIHDDDRQRPKFAAYLTKV